MKCMIRTVITITIIIIIIIIIITNTAGFPNFF